MGDDGGAGETRATIIPPIVLPEYTILHAAGIFSAFQWDLCIRGDDKDKLWTR